PERLPDSGIRDRLAGFTTLKLSSEEIASRYYIPLQMARREIQRQQADKIKQDANGGFDLADLPAGQREKVMELRHGQQQVTDELMQQKLLRAVYSDHQLEEQLVDFWFNHFNVFLGKGPERVYLTEYEREVIRPRVFGKFRDLLGATAHSPA